jgi:hypothetical protein
MQQMRGILMKESQTIVRPLCVLCRAPRLSPRLPAPADADADCLVFRCSLAFVT